MRYVWAEAKRQANLEKHDLDFADVPTENEIRIISFRKATRRETAFLIGHL